MKRIVFISLLVFVMSSCSSTYFYSTLSTTSRDMGQVENGDFLIEKDSLWIAYSFNGENGPMQITIFNKSQQPLYVDWHQSSLIIENQAHAYMPAKATVENTTTTSTWNTPDVFYPGTTETETKTVSQISMPANISFIPPNAMASYHAAWLGDKHLELIPKDAYRKFTVSDKNNDDRTVKRLDFAADNSPLNFKSYLTLHTEDGRKFTNIQEFHVSSLIKSKGFGPKKMPKEVAERGDVFYTEKKPNTAGIEILAGTAIAVGVIVIDAAVSH